MDAGKSSGELPENVRKRFARREGQIKRMEKAAEKYKSMLLGMTLVTAKELPVMVRQEVALTEHMDQQERSLWARQQEFRAQQEAFVAAEEAFRQRVGVQEEDLKERERRVHEEQGEYQDPFK